MTKEEALEQINEIRKEREILMNAKKVLKMKMEKDSKFPDSNETNGYFGVNFLFNYEICRMDFNFKGQIKNNSLQVSSMILVTYILIKNYVFCFLQFLANLG